MIGDHYSHPVEYIGGPKDGVVEIRSGAALGAPNDIAFDVLKGPGNEPVTMTYRRVPGDRARPDRLLYEHVPD